MRLCLICQLWVCRCLSDLPSPRLLDPELDNALQFAAVIENPQRDGFDLEDLLRQAALAWRRVARELRTCWIERQVLLDAAMMAKANTKVKRCHRCDVKRKKHGKRGCREFVA